MKNKLLKTGAIGTLITMICCFTPLYGWILWAIGLAALVGYLDYFLLPLLAFFSVIFVVSGYLHWRRRGEKL
ncbi:mercury resistance system transport protein MerF [Reinekea sp.]|uniref:mercury resistance system transport protein MerF n=1 Tax=Reinekea sp. TaxID=1970455 RepID=UPI002A8359B5|nr:mercury resistance system transport protein MerF [Reinekea sp.]